MVFIIAYVADPIDVETDPFMLLVPYRFTILFESVSAFPPIPPRERATTAAEDAPCWSDNPLSCS